MNTLHNSTLLLPLFAALSTSSLHAVTTYTDLAGFNSATGSQVIESFNNDKAQSDMLTFDGGIISVGVNRIPGSGDNEISGGIWSGNVRNPDSMNTGYTIITWTLPTPVRAFGADFNSIAGSRALSIYGNFDGDGEESFNLRTEIGSGGFFGIVGESTFSTISFRINTDEATIVGNDVFNVDNVRTSTTAVPEPSSTALLGLGSLAILLRRRR